MAACGDRAISNGRLDASNAAKMDPPATFHILRHTYASALAMRGVPMGVIAAQLGHSDTRMTENTMRIFAVLCRRHGAGGAARLGDN